MSDRRSSASASHSVSHSAFAPLLAAAIAQSGWYVDERGNRAQINRSSFFIWSERSLSCCGAEKGQDISVGIGDFEPPQPVVDERQLLHERHAVLTELVEEPVRVHGDDVRVPTSPRVASVVRGWKHVGQDLLEHD